MAKVADTIAGFGFCTDGALPDLSDLDAQLARIEATGASHCELSLYELDLIVGGRVLPERRRRLEQICARRALRYTAHGVLTVNFMDEAHLRTAQGGVPGDARAVRRGRGERAGAPSGQGAGQPRRGQSSACTRSSATRCARWATSPPATA